MFSKILLSIFISQLFMVMAFSQDQNYSEWYLQRKDVDIYVREIGNLKYV